MTAGYTRISDDREGEAKGVGRQRTDIAAKATALAWPDVTDWYEDNDITADPKKKPRPAFDQLLADMASGKVTKVLCYDQDRLVRDMRQLEDVVDAVEAGKVSLTSVNGDIDLTTDNGRMVARIKGAVAKSELEKISRRVKDQQRHNALAGIKKQGRFRTFGYNRDMTPHPVEGPLVLEAFTRKAAGESYTAIAADMSKRGITTTGGGLLDSSAMGKIIRRPDYAGIQTYNGEVVGKTAFEALVDEALFRAANDKATPRRGTNTRKALLSNFLICGVCLTKMKSGAYVGANGKRHTTYRCPGPKAVVGACGSCSIGGRELDIAIFNAAWQKEQSEGTAKRVEPLRDYKLEVAHLEAEITAVRQSALSVVDKVPLLTDLRSKLGKVQKEEAKDVKQDLGTVGSVFDWFPMNLSQRKMWLSKTINYVEVAKADRIGVKGFKPERVTVHYTDGSVSPLSTPDPALNYLASGKAVNVMDNYAVWRVLGPTPEA